MTWNVCIAGRDKDKVKARVRKLDRVPDFVQDAICAAIDQTKTEGMPFVVDTAGHLDSAGGNVKFNVRTHQTIIET